MLTVTLFGGMAMLLRSNYAKVKHICKKERLFYNKREK